MSIITANDHPPLHLKGTQTMNKLAPSILSADFTTLGADIDAAVRGGADYIHVDVMDGTFVPNISLGQPVVKSIRKATDAFLDVHLMVTEPIRYIQEFADAGADLINIHVEASENPDDAVEAVIATGKKVGITLKPGTAVEAVKPYLDRMDLVLVMSVEPGFGGQKFIEDSLDKVRELVRLREEKGYRYEIEIDGGISMVNLEKVSKAGVDVFVAGSAVFGQEDIYTTTVAYKKRLKELDLE